jgi:hypothetical protein
MKILDDTTVFLKNLLGNKKAVKPLYTQTPRDKHILQMVNPTLKSRHIFTVYHKTDMFTSKDHRYFKAGNVTATELADVFTVSQNFNKDWQKKKQRSTSVGDLILTHKPNPELWVVEGRGLRFVGFTRDMVTCKDKGVLVVRDSKNILMMEA